jgi:hypothetical protein
MEKLVNELKQLVKFKDTCDIGDLVLIAAKEPQMLVYAKVLDIEKDDSRRDEWWVVSLALLSIPPQNVKWTLRTPQLTGMEVFTMGGEERFIKAIDFSESIESPEQATSSKPESTKKSFIKRIK